MTDANADIRIRAEIDDRVNAGLQRLNQQLNSSIKSLNSFRDVLSSLNSSSQNAVSGIASLNRNTNSLRATTKSAAENQKLLQIAIKNSTIQANQLSVSMQTLSRAGYSTSGLKAYRSQLMSTVVLQKELNNTMRAAQWGRMSTQLTGFSQRVSQAGMRISMGLTIPLLGFFRVGFQSLKALDKEVIRSEKLIGDSFYSISEASRMAGVQMAKDGKSYTQVVDGQVKTFRTLEGAMNELGNGLDSISYKWGVSRELLQGIAGDFAEIGISTPQTLVDLTNLTTEFEKLGNVDISQAQKTIQSMYQTLARIKRDQGQDVTSDVALNQITNEIRGAVAFFNFAENKTTLSLKNIADAFPEVTAAATTFGLSMQTTAAMLVPMIGAGFQVGASANSIKVSLQRMIVTTKQNKQIVAGLSKALGKDFKVSTEIGAQGIQDLVDSYLGMKRTMGDKGTLEFFGRLFGVRQGPRMDTSIRQLAQFQEQVNTVGSQEQKMLKSIEDRYNERMKLIGSEKRVQLRNIKEVQEFNADSVRMVNGQYTEEAKMKQKIQAEEVAALKKKGQIGEEINKISTESGKLILGQALGSTVSADTMRDELAKVEKSIQVRYGRARESFKKISRDLSIALVSILDALNPIIEKVSRFIENMPAPMKKMIGIILIAVAAIGPLMRGIAVFGQIGSVFARARQGGINAFTGTVVKLNSSLLQTNDLVLRLGGNFTKVGEAGNVTTTKLAAKNIAKLSPLYDKKQSGEALTAREQVKYDKYLTNIVGKKAMKQGTALGPNFNVKGLDLATKDMLIAYQSQTRMMNQAVAENVEKMNIFKRSLVKTKQSVAKVFNIRPSVSGGTLPVSAAPIYPTPTGAPIPQVTSGAATTPATPTTPPAMSPLQNLLSQILASIEAIRACVCGAKAAATGRPSPAASGAPTNAPPSGQATAPVSTGASVTTGVAAGSGFKLPANLLNPIGAINFLKPMIEQATESVAKEVAASTGKKPKAKSSKKIQVAEEKAVAVAEEHVAEAVVEKAKVTKPKKASSGRGPAKKGFNRGGGIGKESYGPDLPFSMQIQRTNETVDQMVKDAFDKAKSASVDYKSIGKTLATQLNLDVYRGSVTLTKEALMDLFNILGQEIPEKIRSAASLIDKDGNALRVSVEGLGKLSGAVKSGIASSALAPDAPVGAGVTGMAGSAGSFYVQRLNEGISKSVQNKKMKASTAMSKEEIEGTRENAEYYRQNEVEKQALRKRILALNVVEEGIEKELNDLITRKAKANQRGKTSEASDIQKLITSKQRELSSVLRDIGILEKRNRDILSALEATKLTAFRAFEEAQMAMQRSGQKTVQDYRAARVRAARTGERYMDIAYGGAESADAASRRSIYRPGYLPGLETEDIRERRASLSAKRLQGIEAAKAMRAPDISAGMKPKSLSAGVQSGATILGSINSQLASALQIPTGVLDQFLQTLKLQGKGLAEVATTTGNQAIDDMALLKQELAKIGLTIEKAIASPREALTQLQAAKFAKGGDIQNMFQRLVMYARDVAERGAQDAFDQTKKRLDSARAASASPAPSRTEVKKASTSAEYGYGLPRGTDEGKEAGTQKGLAKEVADRIRATKKSSEDFLLYEKKTLEYIAKEFGIKGASKIKAKELEVKIKQTLTELGYAIEKAIVVEAINPVTQTTAAVSSTSATLAAATADEKQKAVQSQKELTVAVEKTISNAAQAVSQSAVAFKNNYFAQIASGVKMTEQARGFLTRTSGEPTATPVSVRMPTAQSVMPSAPSPQGLLRQKLAERIATRNNVMQNIFANREAARSRREATTRVPSFQLALPSPRVSPVSVPTPMVRPRGSGVNINAETQRRLDIARRSLDSSSIASVPIPSRPSRRGGIELPPTREQFAGSLVRGAASAAFNPLTTIKGINATIKFAGSMSERIAARLNPQKFAAMSVFKPRDYIGEARQKTLGRVSDRNLQLTGRQARIAEKDARVIAKESRAADRPARGVRVLTQSALPSQFRQSLAPTVDTLKAIANTYGPPLKSSLNLAKNKSIEGLKIAGQVAREMSILPVRVPIIFASGVVEAHKLAMKGLRAGIAQLENISFFNTTYTGAAIIKLAQVLEQSLTKLGGVAISAGQGLLTAGQVTANFVKAAFTNPKQALAMASTGLTNAKDLLFKAGAGLGAASKSIKDGGGKLLQAAMLATAAGAKMAGGAAASPFLYAGKTTGAALFGVGKKALSTDADGNIVKRGGLLGRRTVTDAQSGQIISSKNVAQRAGGGISRGMTGAIRGLGAGASSMSGMLAMQLGPAGMMLTGPLQKIIGLLTKTKAAFFGVSLPIMLVVGTIWLLKKSFAAWGDSATGFVDNLKAAWKSVSAVIKSVKAIFFDFFASLFGGGKDADGATKNIGKTMKEVGKTIRVLAQAFEIFFKKSIEPMLRSIMGGLSLIIRGVVEFFHNVVKFVGAAFSFFRGGGEKAKEAMGKAFGGMLEGVRKVAKGILKFFMPLLNLILLAVQKVVVLIVQIFEWMVIGVVNIVRHMVKGIINLVFTIVKAYVWVIDKVIDLFVGLEKIVINISSFMIKGIVKIIFKIIDAALWVVKKFIQIFGLLPSGIGKIMEKVVGILGKALGGVSSLARKLKLDKIADGIDKLTDSAKDFSKDVADFGKGLADTLIDPISKGLDKAENAVLGFIDTAANYAKNAVGKLGGIGDALLKGLQKVQNGLLNGTDKVADGINAFIGGFSDAIDNLGDDVRGWLTGLAEGDDIARGIGKDIGNAVTEGVTSNPAVAEAAGRTIAESIGEGMKSLKDNFYEKVISNLSDSLGKLKDQVTKALEKQKDQSLKFFDDQIAAIDALAAADAELTAEKQRQEDERLRIAGRALQRDSYIKNRALAIYEGRIDDARTLGLEEIKNQQEFNRETEKNARDASNAAKAKNIDAAKKVIENQKQTASVQFDKDLQDFQDFIENIGKYGTLTKDELTTQFNELKAKADSTSAGMQGAFQSYYDALPGLIAQNTSPTVGFFTSSMDALIAGASAKYGLDTQTSDPSTMLGITNGMMNNIGTVYTNGFTNIVAPAYDEGQQLLTDIATNFADPNTSNLSSAAGIYASAISNATTAVKAEFMKMKTEAGSAFAEVVKAINDELKKLAISKAISDATEELKKNPAGSVSTTTAPSTQTAATPAESPSPSPVVSARFGPANIVREAFEKALGSDNLFKSGDSHPYIQQAKKALSFYGYSGFTTATGDYGTSVTAAMKKFQENYGAKNVTGNLGVESANMLGLFSNAGVQKKYNGGMIRRMMGGSVPGFASQGVPALLHGGEYVINAKAVKNLGLGVLAQLNGLRNGIPSFNVPKPNMPNSSSMNVNVTSHSSTESTHNYNFFVDNFIGEDQWFESMMKDYNMKVVPNNQKAAGLESRVIRTYNGINRGM